VTVEDAHKHLNQGAQYVVGSVGASARDLRPRLLEGSGSNDIGLLSIAPASAGVPLFLGVVIIRGNLRRPSD